MKIALTYFLVIVAVLGIGFWLYHSSQKAVNPENQPGQAYPIVGQTHIAEGTHPEVPYNSNPPTSGDHWPQPASCGIYNATQPDERLVHNLEHGGIWISYKSSVDDGTKAKLNDFARRFNNIIVEPRDADDANIALSAWGHLENLDTYDEGKILEFIKAYIDKGPELVGCTPM